MQPVSPTRRRHPVNEIDAFVSRFPRSYPQDLREQIAERLFAEHAAEIAIVMRSDEPGSEAVAFLPQWSASLTPALSCQRVVVLFAVEDALTLHAEEDEA
jgi:hypothetical protein